MIVRQKQADFMKAHSCAISSSGTRLYSISHGVSTRSSDKLKSEYRQSLVKATVTSGLPEQAHLNNVPKSCWSSSWVQTRCKISSGTQVILLPNERKSEESTIWQMKEKDYDTKTMLPSARLNTSLQPLRKGLLYTRCISNFLAPPGIQLVVFYSW